MSHDESIMAGKSADLHDSGNDFPVHSGHFVWEHAPPVAHGGCLSSLRQCEGCNREFRLLTGALMREKAIKVMSTSLVERIILRLSDIRR
jgi:hypothetical protein